MTKYEDFSMDDLGINEAYDLGYSIVCYEIGQELSKAYNNNELEDFMKTLPNKDFNQENTTDNEKAYNQGCYDALNNMVSQINQACTMGEIVDFIDFHTPKSFSEWEKYDSEKGKNYDDRWKNG